MRNKIISLKTYLKRLVGGNERGVALIFTLGILGLLMVIALAFASTSMVERKVASNVNSNQVAKLLAKSALERIEAGLAYGVDPAKLVSRNNADPRYDWLWKMDTTDSGISIYTTPTDFSSDTCPTWQYVYDKASGTDSQIIGRFAYAVVSDAGKLDPSDVADTSLTPVPRVGVSVSEININNINSSCNDSTWGAKLTDTMGIGGRWTDLTQLCNVIGITSDADKENVSKFFNIKNTPEPEAFWLDSNADWKVDVSTELFHRFNLARSSSEWEKMVVESPGAGQFSILAANKNYAKSTDAEPDTGGIMWLANWTDSAGSFSDAATKKKQVAANLIQYNSAETRAVVSDVTPSNWLTAEPSYTGNKRTPYLNEVGVNVEIAGSHDGGTDDGSGTGNKIYVVTYDLNVRLGAEMIDIYGTDPASKYINCLVLIKGNVTFDAKNASEPTGWHLVTLPVNDNNASRKEILLTRGASPYTINSTGFFPTNLRFSNDGSSVSNSLTTAYSFTTPSLGAPPTIQVNNIKVNIDKVILLDMSKIDSDEVKFLDYTKALAQDWGNTAQAVPVSNTVYFQVKDPRQNLNTGDWDPPGSSGSPGANNANAVPSSGDDSETTSRAGYEGVAAGSHISTAYIRHAPMKSPWELGAIHRGAAWQTLNLNKSVARSGGTIQNGGGTYAEGDANILDQVKFTSNTETYGKVNLNTDIPEVLKGLFGGLTFISDDSSGLKYEKSPESGTAITGDLADMATKFTVLREGYNSTKKIIKNRTEFLNDITISAYTNFNGALYSGCATATDAQKEQLICRFINLTKAEPLLRDEITVIILAQAIKEAQDGVVIYKNWNNTGSVVKLPTAYDSSYKVGYFNAGYMKYGATSLFASLPAEIPYSITSVKGVYQNGADQIVGECKMIVSLGKDAATGKWKIKKVRYAE